MALDGSERDSEMYFDCKNYKSVFEGNNRAKLDEIIDAELVKDYVNICKRQT